MEVAPEMRLKDPVPPAEHPGDDCSEEKCSNEEDISHPLAEQVATPLLPSMAFPSTIASASTTNIGVQ